MVVQKRTSESDLGEVGRSGGGVAASVATIEPARVPVLRQLPQSWDVEAGATVDSVISGEVVVQVFMVAIDPLVPTRVHDVIPPLGHSRSEVHNLGGLWRLAADNVPGVGFSTMWASGGYQGVGFASLRPRGPGSQLS